MSIKDFAKATGKAANERSGSVSGKLLGKLAEGLEALEAMANLAAAKVSRFMELAAAAAYVTKQTLAATHTIPFATPDSGFNPSINAYSPRAPGLGGSTQRRVIRQDKKDGDK